MPRSAIPAVAFFVLALLGAPVAMHVVVHDLAEHHEVHAEAGGIETGHGDHEHPIVASAPPAALRLAPATLPAIATAPLRATACTRAANAGRNVLSFGALRIDEDVGLQPLLATFLI